METADVTERKRFEDTTLLALKKKRKEGAMSQGMQAPLELDKAEIDAPLEPLEGMQFC